MKRRRRTTPLVSHRFGWFLLWSYVVFPSVSATVLRYFHCVSFDETLPDGSIETKFVLQADYRINCRSPRYKAWWACRPARKP